jgi:hypothetical protein
MVFLFPEIKDNYGWVAVNVRAERSWKSSQKGENT